MQSISFKLHSSLSPEAGGERSAWVSAKIGQVELGGSGAPVDFYSILSNEGLSADFSLLTCSCGEAGCAGFFHDPVQVWGDKEVTWQLNAQEYGKHFPHLAAELEGDAPITLHFPTQSLRTAIARLNTALKKLLADGPVLLSPGWAEEGSTLEDFSEGLVRGREWAVTTLERIAREKEAYGPWYDAELVALLPTGQSLKVRVFWVLHLLLSDEADAAGYFTRDESDAYVETQMRDVWRPALASGLTPLFDRMKQAPWEDGACQWFMFSDSRMTRTDTELSEEELWAGAVLRVSEPA